MLKKFLPASLFGRALLILLAPVLLLQAVSAGLFIQRHYAGVTEQMASSVARELTYAVDSVEAAADVTEARERLAELARPLGFELGLDEGALVGDVALRRFYDLSGGALAEALKTGVNRAMTMDLISSDRLVDVRIQTNKGVLRALFPRKRTIASNPHLLLVWTSAAAVLLVVVAVLFLRNQVKPIRQLAAAADSFGKGRREPFRPAGAEEVRRAGAAFLDMRRRLERQIEQRTKMLSGVSHDLRTPLTRMKLALAVADETEENAELARDVDEMERMLEEFLDFARGGAGEAPAPTDPIDLGAAIAADVRRAGGALTLFTQCDTPEAPEAPLRAMAIRRGVGNLIENARRYGETVSLSVRVMKRAVEFIVEDDGPGIPADAREAAFRAFTRLDDSRNQDQGGGVGLGLSIALDIARGHGGEVSLGDSERLGGLKATLRVPR